MKPYLRRSTKGFTLIELLVVIAIIAILAAILFPVFAKARDRARQTTCVNNTKQLGIAFNMYSGDYDEALPLWNFPGGAGYKIEGRVTDPIWDAALYPLVKTKGVFTCPSNSPPNGSLAGYPPDWVIRSYAMPRNISGLALGEVPNPAESVLLFEKGSQPLGAGADSVGEFFQQMWGADQDAMKQQKYPYPHGKGKVFLFTDGHSKYFQVDTGPFAYAFPKETGGGNWPAGYCGDAINGPGYTGGDSNPGANLPK